MNLAVGTGAYRDRSLEAAAEAIAEAGYEAVWIDLDAHGLNADGGLTRALAGRLGDQFGSYDLDVAALVAGELGGEDGSVVNAIRLAADFGTDLVICHAGPGDGWTAALEALREAARLAAESEVLLALEPRQGTAVADLDDAEMLLEAVESDALGIALDVAATAEEMGLEEREVLDRIGDDLLAVILCDLDDRGDPIAPSDDGGTDFATLFELLAEYAPDATAAPYGVTPDTAPVVRALLERLV